MKDLLRCKGRKFSCKILDKKVTGVITVEGDKVYLCQDDHNGKGCRDKMGYKYSWFVDDGSPARLLYNDVTDFQLCPLTQLELDSYKDWQVGDQLTDGSNTLEVIFRSGKLVICEDSEGHATSNYTCDELYAIGFRLVPEDVEDFAPVEVTLEEIAAWKGIPVDKLKITKD